MQTFDNGDLVYCHHEGPFAICKRFGNIKDNTAVGYRVCFPDIGNVFFNEDSIINVNYVCKEFIETRYIHDIHQVQYRFIQKVRDILQKNQRTVTVNKLLRPVVFPSEIPDTATIEKYLKEVTTKDWFLIHDLIDEGEIP